MGYSPFGIEGNQASVKQFDEATGLSIRFGTPRTALAPAGKTPEQKDPPPAPAANADFSIKPEIDKRGFALVIQTRSGEFIIAGSNIVVTNARSRLGTVDEGQFEKGRWMPGRRLNGDETFSGNFFALAPEGIEVRKVVTFTAK